MVGFLSPPRGFRRKTVLAYVQGLAPLAMNYRPLRGLRRDLRPDGASVHSQGCKPLGTKRDRFRTSCASSPEPRKGRQWPRSPPHGPDELPTPSRAKTQNRDVLPLPRGWHPLAMNYRPLRGLGRDLSPETGRR